MKEINKKTSKWGEGGVIQGGNNPYKQIVNDNNFTILQKPNRNVKTDKPYDDHIK